MFAVFFVLGRTWRKWDGWTPGKLFERNAVMDEGTGKFGVYDSEDRAAFQKEMIVPRFVLWQD